MIIDCQDCEMNATDHCKDCFVMSIIRKEPGPLVVEPEEEQAFRSLQQAGLAPVLKFKRKAG